MHVQPKNLPGFRVERRDAYLVIYPGPHCEDLASLDAYVTITEIQTKSDLRDVAHEMLSKRASAGELDNQDTLIAGRSAVLYDWTDGACRISTWFIRNGNTVVIIESTAIPAVYASATFMGKRILQAIEWESL
jgi:hypothetical protein